MEVTVYAEWRLCLYRVYAEKMFFYFLYLYMVQITLIKNKIKFSSYIRKFRRERLPIHIWTTASSNMTKCLHISSYLQEFPQIWGKLNFLFLSVHIHNANNVFIFRFVIWMLPVVFASKLSFYLGFLQATRETVIYTDEKQFITTIDISFSVYVGQCITYCQRRRLQKLVQLKVLF